MEDDLHSRLMEDTGSPAEAERLLPSVRRLDGWPAPEPTRQDTARLLSRLKAAGARTASRGYPQQLPVAGRPPFQFLNLLRSQLSVLNREIGVASALVMILGALVTLMDHGDPAGRAAALPFILIAPVVSAVGVAFIYGPSTDSALEIEMALPVTAGALLLSRLVLVFGFNLMLALVASLGLCLIHSGTSFWLLVSAWLAPMTFLSSLAFLVATLTRDPGIGIILSLGLWTIQSVKELRLFTFRWPELAAGETRLWLWCLAALMVVFALWVAGHEEHWLKQ